MDGVGARVATERKLRGLTQLQLAQRAHVDLVALGASLPALLAELRAYVTTAPEPADGYSLLALVFAAAGQVTYKLGYGDLAALTTERVEWAAARSGDELAASAADFYRAGELIAAGEWTAAQTFLDGARSRIEHRLTDEPGRSMYGQLHLKSALAAARAGDAPTTDAHIAAARELAAQVGEFRDDYDLSFNRHSVDIWSVGLAVELMDGTTAVRRSRAMELPRGVSTERVGHHYIDLARGHLLHGDRVGALGALRTARAVAPQQTRYHPQVHETVRVLAGAERRRSDGLAGFAAWLDVTR